MGIRRDSAFVLATYPLKEKDLIVSLFTRESGKVRGVATGARGKRGRFGSALNQMTEVEISYMEREGRDLVQIREADILVSSIPLALEMDCPFLLAFLAESLETFFQENLPSSRGFRLADHVVKALSSGIPEGLCLTYFSLWILIISGIFPALDQCGVCGGKPATLDLESMECRCQNCRPPRAIPLPAGVLDAHRSIRQQPLQELVKKTSLTGQLRGLEGLTAEVRRHFLQHELRTYRFLSGCDKLFIP